LQGLELLVTVLLARNRQPPPAVAAGVPQAELAAELISLPSGLLAMVCEAIVKLKVRRGGCLCALGGACAFAARAIGEGPTMQSACQSRVRGSTHLEGQSHHGGVLAVLRVVPHSAGFRCGQSPPELAAYGPFAS
jgi:hypothetical protein